MILTGFKAPLCGRFAVYQSAVSAAAVIGGPNCYTISNWPKGQMRMSGKAGDWQALLKSLSNDDATTRAFQASCYSCLTFSLYIFVPSQRKASKRAWMWQLKVVLPVSAFAFSSSCKHHSQQLEPGQWERSQKHIREWKAYISSCTTQTCTDWWVNGHLRLSSS